MAELGAGRGTLRTSRPGELSEAGMTDRGDGHKGFHCLAAVRGPEGLDIDHRKRIFCCSEAFSRQNQEVGPFLIPIFQTRVGSSPQVI